MHLQDLSRQLLNTQETERRNLARELHDEVGQLLTVVKLQLQGAQTGAGGDLSTAVVTIDETINQVRSLSLRLRPSILDDLGLQPALEWQAEQLSQRAGVAVHVTGDLGPVRLPTEMETVFFRVAQESMTNVMKHAGAKSVDITLERSPTHVTMCVCDDGVGFDPAAVTTKRTGGFGLNGMRERVELVGAVLDIDSSPGNGTKLTLCCPFGNFESSV